MFQLQWWNFFENDEALFRFYSLVLLKEQNSVTYKHHFFFWQPRMRVWKCDVNIPFPAGLDYCHLMGQASSQNAHPLSDASKTMGNIITLWAGIKEHGRLRVGERDRT